MSKVINCEECGQPKEVPAYEGDGVYSKHVCSSQDLERQPPFCAWCGGTCKCDSEDYPDLQLTHPWHSQDGWGNDE